MLERSYSAASNTTTEPPTDDPQVGPPPAKAGDSISESDRLVSENLHLRAVCLAHEKSLLALQLQAKDTELTAAMQAITEHRKLISQKYNVDLSVLQVRDKDGVFIPRQSGRVEPPKNTSEG